MKTFAVVTIAIVFSLVMGGCPVPGVTAPDVTEQGLVEGIYSGVVTVNQTARGQLVDDSSSDFIDTIAIDQNGTIIRNGALYTLGRVLVADTGNLRTTFTIIGIQESDRQVLVTFDVVTELTSSQVRLIGIRNDTFEQADDNTIRFQQTSDVTGSGVTLSVVAEGTLTR